MGRADLHGPKEPCIKLGYMGATWQIQLNDPCSAVMQAVAAISVTACSYFFYCQLITMLTLVIRQ